MMINHSYPNSDEFLAQEADFLDQNSTIPSPPPNRLPQSCFSFLSGKQATQTTSFPGTLFGISSSRK
ncbi:hypothetical protein N7507_005848 [Penicillium longicatenatum]|nr:hypothetical protein N7507_005848 [Penicillium longicatenatum]